MATRSHTAGILISSSRYDGRPVPAEVGHCAFPLTVGLWSTRLLVRS